MLVLFAMAVALLASCVPVAPLPAPVAATPAAADVEAGILRAVWSYVHARYPLQPWPDDVYVIPGEAVPVASRETRRAHVVLCSSATGFLWEGGRAMARRM